MTDGETKPLKTCSFCNREGVHGFGESNTETGWLCSNTAACEARMAKARRAADAGRCVDCVNDGIVSIRKLATKADGSLEPGPRCVTHHRALKKARKLAAHAKRTEANFGITGEQYWAIYAMQGGKCFGCQWATGATKRLAVDHDHELALEHGHDPKQGCALCVRALLCGPCNQVIGRLGIEALCRLIQVLADPPARKWLALGDDEALMEPVIAEVLDSAAASSEDWVAEPVFSMHAVLTAPGVTAYDENWLAIEPPAGVDNPDE